MTELEVLEDIHKYREIGTVAECLRAVALYKIAEEESYKKDIQWFIKDLTKDSNGYINIKELVERLVDIDEKYNHEPWNLLQILANIALFVPVKMEGIDKNE